MKTLKIITKIIPFLAVIVLNMFAEVGHFSIDAIKPVALIIGIISVANLIVAIKLKTNDYFTFGILGVAIIGIISIFLYPAIGQVYLENIIIGLYIGLFSAAALPPIFKIKPFTIAFSEKDYPDAIVQGEQFLKINLIINYIWAGIFALAMWLVVVQYSTNHTIQMFASIFVPIFAQLVIGIPVTTKLPSLLMQVIGGKPLYFKTVKDLFDAMPFGLNKELAKDINIVIQFRLTGEEPTVGYLTIKNQVCTYDEGEHSNPQTVINSDSKLWLQIANKEISGDKAYLNEEYTVDGDESILLNFADMFAPPKKEQKQKQIEIDFDYKTFEPNKIKNIVVFDGGYRNNKFSKTTFMVKNFIGGAKQAGANIEYFKLKDHDIKDCTGCYTCWTKTPGQCIFKDNMTILRQKYREADLVIFSSPLYTYNVTGIMKTFMDRLLPVMKPYMLMNKERSTMHPDRFPEKGEQGFVVFSAAGFPDIEDNFDGLKGMYRCWDSHGENIHLMGEFFLPAAEMIVNGIYGNRLKGIADACVKAGKQIVAEGKIDKDFMITVQNPGISKEKYQTQANNFWETLDGIKPFITNVRKLEYENQ